MPSPAVQASGNDNAAIKSCQQQQPKRSSHLQHANDDEIHDLVCVGFGPASLAIAIALHDSIDKNDPTLQSMNPKVRFLERQTKFAWHAGMLLPGAKMQISFIKDLATLRDPRSEFTFINYLFRKERLVQFSNLGTFLPQRIEYEDYMRWCAEWFDDVVDYGHSVESVDVATRDSKTGKVNAWHVVSRDQRSGQTSTITAKNVVIAVGGKPSIPSALPSNHPQVIHSSQYVHRVRDMAAGMKKPRSVAVIGAGQSAAEIFHSIPTFFPEAKSHLIIRGAALRPSDDSPFVNEIFDPDRVDHIFAQEPTVRARAIAQDKGTNYGVVRPELLDEIYSSLYSQRIRHSDEADWHHRILNHRTVTGSSNVTTADDRSAIRLHIHNDTGAYRRDTESADEELDAELIVVASGYVRNAHEDMMKGLRDLMPSEHKRWEVNRDYSIKFEPSTVEAGAGVWLQGCNENTHGLSDTLLSILANRGGEMVDSIFGNRTESDRATNGVH
ncbi:putative L-ornithine 5-monooxygenase [Polychaeton citri CBS 116435]|uniref:L-ornithine N(5)-monooxygenase [NAD(P)H] n=1 Tax=Polychaeton citri CBS 116435 TaxID=1314669 RepID=A0A9P4UL87_9PEZI|nr:putative L-ornithine 5-monooxygenase [Polychaeton citri CBS 116435]